MLATLGNAQRETRNKPRIGKARTARNATQRRISRKERARYIGLLRFCAVLGIVLALVMLYVMLTARLTGLSYAVAKAEHERAELQADTSRVDDRLASLRSDDRLAKVAARLHMQDPQQFAIVMLAPPPKAQDRSHVALLAGLASLFGAK